MNCEQLLSLWISPLRRKTQPHSTSSCWRILFGQPNSKSQFKPFGLCIGTPHSSDSDGLFQSKILFVADSELFQEPICFFPESLRAVSWLAQPRTQWLIDTSICKIVCSTTFLREAHQPRVTRKSLECQIPLSRLYPREVLCLRNQSFPHFLALCSPHSFHCQCMPLICKFVLGKELDLVNHYYDLCHLL